MKKISLLLACITILVSACSVQKRHYLKGFYVSHKANPTTVKKEVAQCSKAKPTQQPLAQEVNCIPVKDTEPQLMASVNNYPFLQLKPHKKMFGKSVVIPAIKNLVPKQNTEVKQTQRASSSVADTNYKKIKRIIGITLIIIGAIILIFAMLFASAPEFADALLGLIIMALIGIGLYILGLLLLLKNRKHKPEIDKITK